MKTIELFDGVGGFRVGLEIVNSNHSEAIFDTIWSNQWETPWYVALLRGLVKHCVRI